MEPNPNSPSSIAGRLIGALPVVGLVARILSDEGGVGGDMIDFAEFRRRVSKKCTVMDSQAFYDFNERRGKVPVAPLAVDFFLNAKNEAKPSRNAKNVLLIDLVSICSVV